jgi:hypothetical protein
MARETWRRRECRDSLDAHIDRRSEFDALSRTSGVARCVASDVSVVRK